MSGFRADVPLALDDRTQPASAFSSQNRALPLPVSEAALAAPRMHVAITIVIVSPRGKPPWTRIERGTYLDESLRSPMRPIPGPASDGRGHGLPPDDSLLLLLSMSGE